MRIKYWAILCSVLVLAACQTTPYNKTASDKTQLAGGHTQTRAAKAVNSIPNILHHSEASEYMPLTAQIYPAAAVKPLSDYAADLAMQLAVSMPAIVISEPVVISSFVNFDSRLKTAGVMGNQLAEHLYHHLLQMGVPVADVKANSHIRVTSGGDYLLSRSQRAGKRQRFALAGTMLRDAAGVVVNARIIELQSQAVISTAQIHIPDFVLAATSANQPSELPSP